ncbi:MAG: hypothetical protein DRR06_16690 [Gammaproteobacteria bacterium]|nr:MAG: hypothetical protein DRR06_16690 [Gammaproteobacteria bacterium]
MSELTKIKFLVGVPPYNAGEFAGLTEEKLKAVDPKCYVKVDDDGEPIKAVKVKTDEKKKGSAK